MIPTAKEFWKTIYLNTKPVRIIETNPLIIRNKIL